MNKKLVALAVAGAFALPMAAQAQTANVTLYGRVNLDYEFVKGQQTDGSNPTINRLSSNSSRLGVRGVESLGGGLSAIFQIESSIVADASGGTLAGRETFVGLQGSWGTFKMGRFLAPYDDIHPIFGNVPTLTTSILSTASLWAQGFAGQPENGGFDDRIRNSIRYDSPTISGFNFEAQYGSYENATHAGVVSLGGFYNNGPIQAGVAYEKHKEVRGNNLDDDAISVAGGYNFGMFRLGRRVRAHEVRSRQRRPEARPVGRQRHRQSRPGPALSRLHQGERGQGLGIGRGAGGGPRPRQRYRCAAIRDQLHVSAVEAHAGLCRLRQDRQQESRAVHVQHQLVSGPAGRRSAGGVVFGLVHFF